MNSYEFIVHVIKNLRKIGKILHDIVPTAEPIALRDGGRSENLVGKYSIMWWA